MEETESKDGLLASETAHEGIAEFEAGLLRARELLRNDDLNGAYVLLTELESGYLRGADVFLLLGEVLHRLGQVARAERYRTLHDILKANFRVIEEAESRTETGETVEYQRALEALMAVPQEAFSSGAHSGEERAGAAEVFVPVTAAMSEEFMRQGHYQRALEIYDKLLEKQPEDAALREARDLARKKAREKHLLGVFDLWLKNIQRIKSDLSGEA